MVLIAIYMLSVLYGVLMPIITKRYNLPSSIANQLPAYMSYFVCGMGALFFFEKIMPKLNKLIFIAFPLLIGSIILKKFEYPVLFEPVALCIVVLWFSFNIKNFFKFSKIHDYSYPLYLIHYPIIMLIKEFV